MRIGILMRVFAVLEELVETEVQKAMNAVLHLVEMRRSFPEIGTILLVVPTDKRFIDADCGETAEALREKLTTHQGVVVVESPIGDISCLAMNFGFRNLERSGHTHTWTFSATIHSYVNETVIRAMLHPLATGARIVPLAVGDERLRKFVLNGRPLGTCTIWENESLGVVGGFNPIASRPMRVEDSLLPQRQYVDDLMGTARSAQYVPFGGMEEMLTTLMIIQHYGRCIAPVDPTGVVAGEWMQPITEERMSRETQKLLSKIQRTIALSMMFNAGPGVFRLGILSGYEPKAEDIDF
jgi:hypothetical protein